ncbi:sodium:proton antiporter [Pseudomonas sp. RIT-PI-AD]|uniref:sodium:proton antiporter n=1 Tax=Pseudomonas sp. RIT-PI-AD TaxID=3035294 RepID=UPI0021DB1AC5|nr:sodium:proton antiporter [Pseudomonas sp. RIT-PI-AD]
MSDLLFWLATLTLFAGATLLGRRLGLIPIVSQLLAAVLCLPPLALWLVEPLWGVPAAQLTHAPALELAYGVAFALLLGYILSDVVDLRLSAQSLRIAVPSFAVPLACGLACAAWLLPPQPWLGMLAVGLLFAITAIPVLYLFLQGIDYPAADVRRLLHAAILMDLFCWSLFGLAQGSVHPAGLFWPLLAALLPLPLRALRLRAPLAYSLPFFLLMPTLHLLGLNALVFGIAYLLVLAMLRQPFRLPLPPRPWALLQNGVCIPLILAVGVLRVDFRAAFAEPAWALLALLLLAPPASKLLGNWLGLHWANPRMPASVKWRESLLLNIRGLTEIVFLNLLFQQGLITAQLYVGLLLMSLLSTLLPALLGLRAPSASLPVQTRHSHEPS